MKKLLLTTVLAGLMAAGTYVTGQNQNSDYLGLPGDNLNLYAVMKLFQDSKTLEDFERNLNDPDNHINNLDLNGDNMVDYIKVFDNIDGNVHNIVLQVAINQRENQDVAVFTVQRFNNGEVQIQLTGDELLYGKNYIIEPIYGDSQGETPNPGYTGNISTVNGQTVTVIETTPFEIAAWPLVRFLFLPGYIAWHSSWYWGHYPSYWNPWRPFYWHYYYGYQRNWYNDYYGHYRLYNNHRYAHWNDYYYNNRRVHSNFVNERIQDGYYRTAYSHPEQRRDGEALYARLHNDRNNQVRNGRDNRTNNSSGSDRIKRVNTRQDPVQPQSPGRNSNPRRAVSATSNRSQSNQELVENTNNSRKSDSRVNVRSSADRSQVRSTDVTTRPATSNRSQVQRPASGNRPATTVNSRTVSERPVNQRNVTEQKRVQNVTPSQPARQPKSTVSSRTEKRQSGRSQSATTTKKGEKSKVTDTRRK